MNARTSYVTDWHHFSGYGLTAYRIHMQCEDGRNWWQRHEWKRINGSTEFEAWIACPQPSDAWIKTAKVAA